MAKRQCECCLSLTENDFFDANNESVNLISLCFSIQITNHSIDNSLIYICNICNEKLKDCNEFRCQILVSQAKLRKLQALVAPKIESDSVVFKCESKIKEELMSDCDDSMDADNSAAQSQSHSENEETEVKLNKKELKLETNQTIESNSRRVNKKSRASIKKPREVNPEKQKNYRDCLKYISNKSILDCGICGEKFNSHNLLVSHMAIHCPNFTCKTCGKSFLLKRYLHRHMKSHEEEEKVTCTICSNDVKSSYLRKHMKIHAGYVQNFTCSICSQRFESHHQRIKHMEQVHNVDIFKHRCKFCPKKFYRLGVLNEHIRQHHKTEANIDEGKSTDTNKKVKSKAVERREKKYAEFIPFELDKEELNCKVCGEDFVSYKSLISHLAIHYPNFICDTCGKPFLLQQHLASHVKSHEGENVSCTICKKVLKSHYLPLHMKIHSGKRKRSVCPHCGERFESHVHRVKHMEKVHNVDIYKHNCNFCSKKFYMLGKLNVHIRQCHFKEVNITCNECGKGFFTTNELKNHIVKHTGEKNFTCDVCSKSYTKKWSLVLHMRTHGENVKKYKCLQCDKEFTQNGSLKVHIKNMHEKKEMVLF